MLTDAGLMLAALATGILNTASGGGAILTYLALTVAGIPPLTAHATSQFVTPVSFLIAARDASRHGPDVTVLVTGCLGTVAGVGVLAVTPPGVFQAVAPFVLVPAAVVVVVQGWVKRRLNRSRQTLSRPITLAATMACGVYAGLIGIGSGTLVLAVLGLATQWPAESIGNLMRTRNVLLLGMALVVAGTFATTGLVNWRVAALLVLPGWVGGWLGTKLVGHLPDWVLRAGVSVTAVGATVWMLLR